MTMSQAIDEDRLSAKGAVEHQSLTLNTIDGELVCATGVWQPNGFQSCPE